MTLCLSVSVLDTHKHTHKQYTHVHGDFRHWEGGCFLAGVGGTEQVVRGREGLPGAPGKRGLEAAAGGLGENEALQLQAGPAGAPDMTAEPWGEAQSTLSKGSVPQDSPF